MAQEGDRITQLEARVAELEAKLAEIVARARDRRMEPMRASVRCPACGGRRIARASKVADRDGGQQMPMAVSTKGTFFPEARGVFGCDVCLACGYVEWHIEDPSAIDLERSEIELVEIEHEQAGPYR
jgi:hypothetical protein